MWAPLFCHRRASHTFGWIARVGTEVASLYTHDGVVKCASAEGISDFELSAVLPKSALSITTSRNISQSR